MDEVKATKTEGKLYHLLNDGNVTDEGGLTVCNCSNMFVSKKKSVLNANHLVQCWNENEELKAKYKELREKFASHALKLTGNEILVEELKAKCEAYAKDYNSMVAEVQRLSRSNGELLEALNKILELPQTIGHAYQMQDISKEAINKASQ